MRTVSSALVALLLIAPPAVAEDSRSCCTALTEHTLTAKGKAARPEVSIEAVSWIAGHWSGEALGGTSEEIWSEPAAGTMLGSYRLIRNGRVAFYEILTISEDEDRSLTLRLKHFNADLTGWEEKDETVSFPLIRIEDGRAWFDGMTFTRESDDSLTIHLAMRDDAGGVREATFRYQRTGAGHHR